MAGILRAVIAGRERSGRRRLRLRAEPQAKAPPARPSKDRASPAAARPGSRRPGKKPTRTGGLLDRAADFMSVDARVIRRRARPSARRDPRRGR